MFRIVGCGLDWAGPPDMKRVFFLICDVKIRPFFFLMRSIIIIQKLKQLLWSRTWDLAGLTPFRYPVQQTIMTDIIRGSKYLIRKQSVELCKHFLGANKY